MGRVNLPGPTTCTLVITEILNLLICKIFGGKFISSLWKYLYHIVGYVINYDTDLLPNTRSGYDIIEDVAIGIQKAIDLVKGSLKDSSA